MQNGMFMGVLGFISVAFMWWHMPKRAKLFSLNHPILTDVATGVILFWTMSQFSKSITCMVATVVAPLLMEGALLLINTERGRKFMGLEEPSPGPTMGSRMKNYLLKKPKQSQ